MDIYSININQIYGQTYMSCSIYDSCHIEICPIRKIGKKEGKGSQNEKKDID